MKIIPKESTSNSIKTIIPAIAISCAAVLAPLAAAQAETVLTAPTSSQAITVDGDAAEWAGITGITVPVKGKGNVDSVDLKATVHGDKIYILAVWKDATESALHKPYKWDDAKQAYGRTKQLEDRLAFSFAMSGAFTANKVDGSAYSADVWHWKAARTNPAGVAHDKMHVVSTEKPEGKSKKLKSDNGGSVYLLRPSDEGGKLYKSTKYDAKDKDVMPRYKVTENPTGSIADIQAKGVWKDGVWTLEIARKLDTGNKDDAVIPANGTIEFAIAAFNDVDGRDHSTSEKITLKTGS